MASPIIPVVTLAGLAAAMNAQVNGITVELTDIAVGSGEWVPDDTATALMTEEQRVPIAGSHIVPPNQLHLSALLSGPDEYWINEVGIYGNGNVLMAIWSRVGEPFAYKSADVDVILNHDLLLTAYPPESITVSNITNDLNLTWINEIVQLSTAIIAVNAREVQALTERLSLDARVTALEIA